MNGQRFDRPAQPLTEADLDAHERWKAAPWPVAPANHAHRYSACKSGPCAGGTKLCPSPEACQCVERDDYAARRAGAAILLLIVVVLMTAAIVVTALIAAGYA